MTCRLPPPPSGSTILATLTSVKTVTDKSTTTVFVNAKRDLEALEARGSDAHLNNLNDRALADFAAIGRMFGHDMAVNPVASACSCFSSMYTAPAVTTTTSVKTTVTVAVAKATTTVTTTVKGFTV